MTGKALICKLGEHIPIEAADKIVQVDMFGETIITQKTNEEGTVGLLFDCETKLSHEYASANNMYRHSNLNKDESVTGYLEDNARIRPIKLKGVKCSGLFMPLDTIATMISSGLNWNKGVKWTDDMIGQEIDEWDGKKICEKYISPKTARARDNKQGKAREILTPTFKEHIDTDQWGRNMHKVKSGDLMIITEKLHGTSGRCGLLPTKTKLSWWKTLCGFLADGKWLTSIEVPKFVVGSRRVVKSIEGEEVKGKQHYYDHDLWTQVAKENFEGKLRKGETVYFEIVGYDLEGGAIMGTHNNDKLKPFLSSRDFKEFKARYGEHTQFSYGCTPISSIGAPQQKVFVYRITTTNEDGESIDYSWEQVKARCEQMNVGHVPELEKGIVSSWSKNNSEDDRDKILSIDYGTSLEDTVNEYTESGSELFKEHIREGVCIRIENKSMTPLILKSKSFIFKCLEGIIKDTDTVDIEEAN